VIGDGAMSAGMAFEAMNNAGHLKQRLFVILNDNEMSIAPAGGGAVVLPVAALCRSAVAGPEGRGQGRAQPAAAAASGRRARAKDMLKGMAVGGTLFEELGFSYVGPIDGHDLDQLLPVLRTVRRGRRGRC
jgi:1-deoxy-D-xylulose-5-phosphate synthase